MIFTADKKDESEDEGEYPKFGCICSEAVIRKELSKRLHFYKFHVIVCQFKCNLCAGYIYFAYSNNGNHLK